MRETQANAISFEYHFGVCLPRSLHLISFNFHPHDPHHIISRQSFSTIPKLLFPIAFSSATATTVVLPAATAAHAVRFSLSMNNKVKVQLVFGCLVAFRLTFTASIKLPAVVPYPCLPPRILRHHSPGCLHPCTFCNFVAYFCEFSPPSSNAAPPPPRLAFCGPLKGRQHHNCCQAFFIFIQYAHFLVVLHLMNNF